MKKKKIKKIRHLTDEDRMSIQACICKKMSLTQIANYLKVNKSTISRELKRNARYVVGNNIKCKSRKLGLCNNCCKRAYCNKEKRYYDYKYACMHSNTIKTTSRSKTRLSKDNLIFINEVVSQGVRLGQSLHHIYISNPSLKLICSERTIRRLCYKDALDVKKFELRRYVTYKHKLDTPKEVKLKDLSIIVNRTYRDYENMVNQHPLYNIVQYDSVIGKRDDIKAILTITFPKYSFQFGLLINKGSPLDVKRKIQKLFKKIGKEQVKKIFPINLADNGFEFSYFHQIEEDEESKEKICSTFFTNPYRATDKAECERLHEFIRYFIPKYKSLNSLTQEMLNEMFSNINSYVRASKNDQTPYDMVLRKYGKEFLDAIGIKRIPNKKVRLLQIL